MRYQVFYRQPALRRTLVAFALAAAYSSSWALPVFTLNPSAAGMNGTQFTADNILISDFSSVSTPFFSVTKTTTLRRTVRIYQAPQAPS